MVSIEKTLNNNNPNLSKFEWARNLILGIGSIIFSIHTILFVALHLSNFKLGYFSAMIGVGIFLIGFGFLLYCIPILVDSYLKIFFFSFFVAILFWGFSDIINYGFYPSAGRVMYFSGLMWDISNVGLAIFFILVAKFLLKGEKFVKYDNLSSIMGKCLIIFCIIHLCFISLMIVFDIFWNNFMYNLFFNLVIFGSLLSITVIGIFTGVLWFKELPLNYYVKSLLTKFE